MDSRNWATDRGKQYTFYYNDLFALTETGYGNPAACFLASLPTRRPFGRSFGRPASQSVCLSVDPFLRPTARFVGPPLGGWVDWLVG